MPSRRLRVLAPFILLLAHPLFAAEDIKVSPGNVEDQRFSDDRLGGLSIELLLKGGMVADVKALRVRLKSAKDDVGTVLSKRERDDKPGDFEEFSTDRRPGPQVHLRSPRRDASKVEVAGEVELFIPARDPNTKQRIGHFLSRLDKPISNAALKSAKVEITPLSPMEYKARQVKNRPNKEELIAEAKKDGATEKEIQQALALMEALSSLGGEEPSDNSILLETKDPDGKIILMSVARSDGTELHASSQGSTGSREMKIVKIDLSEKPPADAELVVTLRTAKSVVAVPLNWNEVALP